MTNAFKFLIDTNIVIGLEDHHAVDVRLTELARKCSAFGVRLFVDAAVVDDVRRDANLSRQAITLSKLERFERLEGIHCPPDLQLACRYGSIRSDNDRNDCRLLFCLEQGGTDFLITLDIALLKRARRCGLSHRVMSVEDALTWLRQTFEPTTVDLPHIAEQEAYALDRANPIFDGLREDYPGFDRWLEKCARTHRKCWVVTIRGEVAGLIIRKDETREESHITRSGNKILKLCTFIMSPKYRGEKFGEHLLKQALWFAQVNGYDIVYLTAFPDKEDLIALIQCYGFTATKKLDSGEVVFEKFMHKGLIKTSESVDILDLDRKIYPRFYDGPEVAKYCVPIRGEYHKKLFPEISYRRPLPLFARQGFAPELAASPTQERTPGNTIRKVYLCRAQANSLRPGDLLFFYLSKNAELEASQSITTIGVVERISECFRSNDLIRMTAKRSVFSAQELERLQMASTSPVKVIDFLLVGHSRPTIPLCDLLTRRVFAGRPPQSIARLDEERYGRLKQLLNLGFDP